MIRYREKKLGFIFFIALTFLISARALASNDPVWYGQDENHQPVIHLYFFWSEKCPHCQQALPDIIELDKQLPWLKLHSLELIKHPENRHIFVEMASLLGTGAQSVPTFMFCGNSISGYENRKTTGQLLRTYLQACYRFAGETNPDNTMIFKLDTDELTSIDIPVLGHVSLEDYSLPMMTVLIAGMDAFNPCAFFVLLFLLSMMVHGRSRSRMALIGGIFVFFSGAVYFLFMAAWLNLFIYLGELQWITLIAGIIAIFIALINIKDFFWFKKGISLTISDEAKPLLFDRMRELLRLDSVVAVIFATVVLAVVANSYELLCTAGFPMVYTRILTLASLPTTTYYLYLLLYNLIYILPLLVIVMLFSIKLGSRKMSEQEGRVLKLLSGMMMLLLGTVMVLAPQLLNNVIVAAAIILVAVSGTWLLAKLKQKL